jgi:hypothetical protein
MSDRIPAISRLVNRIREAQAVAAEAQASIEALMPQLDAALREASLNDYVTETGHAFYKPQKGRVSNVVNARKFQEVVSEDDFFGCIAVSITEARKVLAQRELDKITTVIQPEPKAPLLVVEAIDNS